MRHGLLHYRVPHNRRAGEIVAMKQVLEATEVAVNAVFESCCPGNGLFSIFVLTAVLLAIQGRFVLAASAILLLTVVLVCAMLLGGILDRVVNRKHGE